MTENPPFDPRPTAPESDGPWSDRFRLASRVLAVLVTAFGSLVFIGWVVDSEALKALSPNGVTVKTNTSVALALSGIALLLLGSERRGRFRDVLGRLCALIAGAIGLATLSQHLFGWDLGIDQLLFREAPGSPATSAPNRMGPPASTCFPLLAASILLIDRRVRRGASPAQILAFAVMLLAAIPMLGYIYGVTTLYGISRLTGIAFTTAVAFVLLSLGILFARPYVGPMRLFIREDSGGELMRRMLPASILMPVILGYLRGLGERAGFYDNLFGRTLLIFSFMVLFSVWTWRVASVLSSQAQARARAEASELGLKDRLVRILENISQGFCALDLTGRCTYVNREAERLTGRSRALALGQPLDELYPERRYPELHAGIRRATGTQQVVHVETRDDATGAWFDHDIVPTAEGITLFTRDVTDVKLRDEERRRLLEGEREARSIAEHSNRMKDEFLATLSHELRTPLNAILGWSMLLGRAGLSAEEARRGHDAIERNARLQARLIEDLLDMSRIVSGQIRLDLQDVDLPVIVDNVLLAVTPTAESRQIRITRAVESATPPVRGDAARLQQILWNLMSNALKFTPRHGHVTVSLQRSGESVELSVEDDGTGISPDFLPHVFDRFRQADASTTRRHGGLGLGLAISRQLAEIHGGSLTAESEGPNRGAKFTLRLPLEAAAGRALSPQPEKPAEAADVVSLAGIRVLVVEDQQDTRELLEHMLRERQAQVRAVDGHDAALEIMSRERFDVLVSDIGMPGRDGYSLMRETRERHAFLPGVALTAFAREEDRRRAIEAGFRDHLPKPVQPDRLAAVVARLAREAAMAGVAMTVGNGAPEVRPAAEGATPPPSDPEAPAVDSPRSGS